MISRFHLRSTHLHIVIAMLLLLFSAPAAFAETLRLNDTNEPPFTTPAHDGFVDVIAAEAFRRAGVSLALIKLPAERGLMNANAGIDDGDLARIAGLDTMYPNLVMVPESLVEWEFVAYGKNAAMPALWPDIRKTVVGHVTGWKIYESQLQGAPQVVAVSDSEQLFQLLARDRIEIALYAKWMGDAHLKALGLSNIHQLEPPLAKKAMFIYLNKKHSQLIPKLAASLRQLKQEGFYQRMYQEKLLPYSNKSVR